MAIEVVNESNVPINVALHWNSVLQFIENELQPGQSVTWATGIGWHDFTTVVDHGDNRFDFKSNFDGPHIAQYGFSLAGWAMIAGGVIAAPATGGASLALTVLGVGLEIGKDVVTGWLAPATIKGLFASDFHRIAVGVPGVQLDASADGRDQRLSGKPVVESLNLQTGNVLVESGWTGAEASAFLNGTVYAVQGGKLWSYDRWRWSRELGSGWGGTEAMTALNGKLYAVQGGKLWEKEPPGPSKELSSGWGGTEAMTALNGKLYAVQGGKLWEKEPHASSEQIGKAVYHPVPTMVATDWPPSVTPLLALVAGDQMWLVSSQTIADGIITADRLRGGS